MWKFWVPWTIDAVVAAIALALVLAVPGALTGLSFLVLVASHPRWN